MDRKDWKTKRKFGRKSEKLISVAERVENGLKSLRGIIFL
jgi:3-methyladenine DNA glycosylase/8-oxoguanine DNA glycosylase